MGNNAESAIKLARMPSVNGSWKAHGPDIVRLNSNRKASRAGRMFGAPAFEAPAFFLCRTDVMKE